MKYNCAPSARSKHITNSYLEATIEDHKIHIHFSETMMASAKDNNAMPPQPLLAPLDVDPTQRFPGGYAMQNRGQSGSPAAQIGVRRQRRCRRRGGGATPLAGGGRRDRRGAGNGRIGGCLVSAPPPSDEGWRERVDTAPHCHLQLGPGDELLLLGHGASADGNGPGG